MKKQNKLTLTLTISIIFIILTSIVIATHHEEDQMNDPAWYADKDMSTMLQGFNQNPILMEDPLYFMFFEERIAEDPVSLNNNPIALVKFGEQIGVLFIEGSGIASYETGTRVITTTGCIGTTEDCTPKPSTFSAHELTVTINPDGSIYVTDGNFDLLGGVVTKTKDTIIIKSGIIKDTNNQITIISGNIKTKGDGIFQATGKTEITTDNKIYKLNGNKYNINLIENNQPTISTQQPLIITNKNDVNKEVRIGKGSVIIETQDRFKFSKDSTFSIWRKPSRSVFNVKGETRFCFQECYGLGKLTGKDYADQKVSTIELLEPITFKGTLYPRNALKINSITGDVNAYLEHPDYDSVMASVHVNGGEIEIKQYGEFSTGNEYFSTIDLKQYFMYTTSYGNKKGIDKPLPVGGSPVLLNWITENNLEQTSQQFTIVDFENGFINKQQNKIDLLTYSLNPEIVTMQQERARGVIQKNPSLPKQDLSYDFSKKVEESRRLMEEASKLTQTDPNKAEELLKKAIERPNNPWGGQEAEEGDYVIIGDDPEPNEELEGWAKDAKSFDEQMIEDALTYGMEGTDAFKELADRYMKGIHGLIFIDGEITKNDVQSLNAFMPYTTQETRDNFAGNLLEIAFQEEDPAKFYEEYVNNMDFLSDSEKQQFTESGLEQIKKDFQESDAIEQKN
jgi:hypothetical protein